MLWPFKGPHGRFGSYHVVRMLHEGDKSTVYLADSSRSPGDRAVIKLYKAEYDRLAAHLEEKHSIPSEAEVGLRLNPQPGTDPRHYPIVITKGEGREFGRRSGCRYLVLEYVEGVSLRALIICRDTRVRKYPRVIVVQGCQALGIIHRAGLVCRDFGPQNIIVRADMRLKLTDLGFVAPAGMAFPERSGSPTYMSPEQIMARRLGPASDIYSLGITIHELLTGNPPYVSRITGHDPKSTQARRKELMQMHLEEPVPRLPQPIARESPRLSDVMAKCLQKDPRDRFTSVDEIIKLVGGTR